MSSSDTPCPYNTSEIKHNIPKFHGDLQNIDSKEVVDIIPERKGLLRDYYSKILCILNISSHNDLNLF